MNTREIREKITNSYAGKKYGTMPIEKGLKFLSHIEQQDQEIDRLREREFNHYPILILEIEIERDEWKTKSQRLEEALEEIATLSHKDDCIYDAVGLAQQALKEVKGG
jgi:hypothetical protein